MTTGAAGRPGHSWDGVSVPAEQYERHLVPALFEPWARVIMDVAEVGPGDRVLDVACGTGVVAQAAARLVGADGHVCGIDVNGDMLAVARSVRSDIEWRQADAGRTGLEDASCDVVICQQGLQFVPDPLAALREMRRVLAPGGRVVLTTWCATDGGDVGYTPVVTALRRHCPEDVAATGFIAAVFGLSDGAEVARLAEEAGFAEVVVERRTGTVRFPSAAAWVEAFLGAAPVPSVAAMEPATRAAVVADAAVGLTAYVDAGGLAFPLHTNIATCR